MPPRNRGSSAGQRRLFAIDGGQAGPLTPTRSTRTHQRPEKPAAEQPGNSFRYLYQRLNEKEFQQLCGALIRDAHPDARCFPVGMSDGGRDLTDADEAIIYQVKWTSKVEQDAVSWLKNAVEAERVNIERLVQVQGARKYRLMTSVAGTSTPKRGTMDRLDEELKQLSKSYGIHMQCLWQADIDSMVDNAPDATKWSYADMLVGHDLIRYLIHGAQIEGRAAEMRETLLKVMAAQWGEDAKVKFSQVDMDHLNIVELFVDVEETLDRPAKNAVDAFVGNQQSRGEGAVQYLLRTTMPLTLVRGEPGQGKSTLGQYLSQVHRAAILPSNDITMGKSPDHSVVEPKLPLRADLKDYATWLLGQDPWGETDRKAKRPKAAERSLEYFLAALCTYHSGGRSVSVEQIQDLTERYPTLVVLDGLDEVADTALRSEAVEQINAFARRMGGTTTQRRFQIVVTTRPNNGGLQEPSQDMFETVKLVRVSPALQREYLRKWTSAHQIRGRKQRQLMNVFRARSAQDHVAELAENLMQLTILLYLVNRRGEGVPDARTPMYTQFMDTLLDREVEKAQVVKDNVPLIYELTAYLGWLMQAGVESRTVPDRLETKRIKRYLRNYLDEVDGPLNLVDQLFSAISDRFWALSSKIEGTFEFSVHSVREYFAARFLAEYVGLFGSPVLKSDVLQALIERSYWANTARFYAGFASPNELLTLVAGLQESIEDARHPLQTRAATLTLLADGVFAPVPKAQKAAAYLLADPLTVRLLHPAADLDSPVGDLPTERGGGELASRFMIACAASPEEPISRDRVRLLPRLGVQSSEFEAWWRPQLDSVLGSADETHWLILGACFPKAALGDAATASLALKCVDSRRAAIALNARPPAGSSADATLIRSVLDGELSDIPTTSTSTAADLLKVLRPQHYLRLAKHAHDPLYLIPVGHLSDLETERKARSSVFKRLAALDPRYRRIMRVSAVRLGESGTTAPWQHTARELAAIHGNCLLAAEIAIAGAAQLNIQTGGSISTHAPAFGGEADYGILVQETRAHRSSAEWWINQIPLCNDDLSRITWALAFVAVADPLVIGEQIAYLDRALRNTGAETFLAGALASSRLGASALGRRLPEKTWAAAKSASERTQLLIAHHSASLKSLDPLPGLSDFQLGQLARYDDASWPATRAITARLLTGNDDIAALLEALEACGPDATITVPAAPAAMSTSLSEVILSRPEAFPLGWIVATERWRSAGNVEPPLATVAVERKWVPEL